MIAGNSVSETRTLGRVISPCASALSCAVLVCAALLWAGQSVQAQQQQAEREHTGDFSAADVAAAQQFGQTLGVADWLGPLAPVALSPFFGITCLSAMALFGEGWVSEGNAFLGDGSPLNNPAVFWTFLILTLVTSIPRLTKVSKPFAQAVDQIEAWAGIITLVALKMMMGAEAPDAQQATMIQAGVGAVTIDTLLMVAAAINIFVINAVKFFFEVLIWITPVPAIDAVFEFANKTVCAVLMAIYGYSPTIATGINLAMFVAAAFVFSWAYRRQVFFRTLLVDAVWQLCAPPSALPNGPLTVFPVADVDAVAARSRCDFRRTETGWTLTQRRFLRENVVVEIPDTGCSLELNAGYLCNSFQVSGLRTCELSFSRLFNGALPGLAQEFGAAVNEQNPRTARDRSGLRTELA